MSERADDITEAAGADTDIAIVGMAGRFPGAPSADELWRRVGPSYERIASSWNMFLDTLTDEELEVADTVLRQASELNAAEIRRLRGADGDDR